MRGRTVRRWVSGAALLALPALMACSGSSPTAPSPTAAATRIMVLSGDLTFNQVDVGSTVMATLVVANTGTAPLTVTGITGSGRLTSEAVISWTSGTIAAGASQEVTLAFRPTSLGAYAGALVVSGDHTAGVNTMAYSAEVMPALRSRRVDSFN